MGSRHSPIAAISGRCDRTEWRIEVTTGHDACQLLAPTRAVANILVGAPAGKELSDTSMGFEVVKNVGEAAVT